MNIVHLARRFTRDAWGGTESAILETSKALQARGHLTHVISSNALSSDEPNSIAGIPVERTPYFYPYLGLSASDRQALDLKGGNLFSFSMARALWRHRDLDVLHLHTGKRLGAIGRTVARLRGRPYVMTLHGGVFTVPPQERQSWTAPAKNAYEWGKALGWCVGSRRVLHDAAAVICVGRDEYETTRRQLPNTRVEHVPNGVDVARFASGDRFGFRRRHGIPDEVPLLLTVGRIDPQKGQHVAVDVLDRLSRDRRQPHLVLLGPPTDRVYHQRLLDRIQSLGLGGRVQVHPGLPPDSPDLVDAYHAADVFLLPSLHEPFGIVVLEAWAAGLPVVASRVGGVPGFTSAGQDCLLFDSEDVGQASQLVRQLLDHPAFASQLAEAGHRRAQEAFGWPAIAARLERLYEEVFDARVIRH